MKLPLTLEMFTGVPPSILKSILLAPFKELIPMVALVPLNVNDTPVPGQVSSLVAGLTRPRYRGDGSRPFHSEGDGWEKVATTFVRRRTNKDDNMTAGVDACREPKKLTGIRRPYNIWGTVSLNYCSYRWLFGQTFQ